jgi:3-methyladenine DNA glycosylase AlkD
MGQSVAQAADAVRRELERLSRPASGFDASRYFRGADHLGFHNVGMAVVRDMARSIYAERRGDWSVGEAMAFADKLIVDRFLETKSVGISVLARYRRSLTPALLPRWKAWLAGNHSSNWATTDAICGELIGPVLIAHPAKAAVMRAWSKDGNMWVRRASIVGLCPLARHGQALDLVYEIARRLHVDKEDLIQKAVGWALREAGKTDPGRLERYLRANGPSIPRTTVRYAIERFPPAKRKALMAETRG